MTRRSVVITGAGVVPFDGFDARSYFRVTKALKLTDARTRFAVAASTLALADADWRETPEANEALGVFVGTSGSDLQAEDLSAALGCDPDAHAAEDIQHFGAKMLAGLNPLWLLINLPNMASAHVAIQVGARGPNNTVMTDWIAGLQALGEASDLIAGGDLDAALAGGADVVNVPFAIASIEQAGLRTSRVDDTLQGDGGAMLLLEHRAHAEARGAAIKGELLGYATASAATNGADHGAEHGAEHGGNNTAASEMSKVIARALAQAGLDRDDIDVTIGSAHLAGVDGAGAAAPVTALVRRLDAATKPLTLLCAAAGTSGQCAALVIRTAGIDLVNS